MQEIKKWRKKYSIGAVIAFVVLIAVFGIMVSSYLNKFDRTLRDENRQHLSELANHISFNFQSVIKSTQYSLEIAAEATVTMSNRDDKMKYLHGVAEKYGFDYVGYADADGQLYATESSQSGDISKEIYFQKALAGESTITGLVRRIFNDKSATGVIMAVPITDIYGNRQGALVAMVDVLQLQNVLRVESFGGEGYAYIIDKQGNLVLRTKSMDYNNLFRVLENVKFEDGFSFAQSKADMTAGQTGMTVYNNLGTVQYAYYHPLGINDWVVVNIVPRDIVAGKTAELTRGLVIISVVSIVVFLILLLFASTAFIISEKRRQATEAKSAFLANMSHEIRTPMNAIVGISEILLRGGLTAKQRDYVLSIINSGKSLLTIINDILDLSKIEAGKFTIVDEVYEIESVLYDITSIAAVRIGDKPVMFFIDIDPEMPNKLIGDTTRVKQVLLNIIGNAIKFTEEGYVKLIVRCSVTDGIADLTFVVEDSGIGIKEDDLQRLFISFNQVNTHYKTNIEGTGLGLAISKRLSEMMNGRIDVVSEFGKGTEFTIAIKQGVPDCLPLIDVAKRSGERVLLFEKSLTSRAFYESCMARMGLDFVSCEDSETFERNLYSGEFSHALTDRLAVRRLALNGWKDKTKIVILLRLEEHTLMSMDSAELTIYVPLFPIQLSCIMRRNNDDANTSKRAGVDMMMINPLPNVRILIVDDNEVNLQVASGLMQPYDMQIDCVVSGQEAIRAVQEVDYDLVFMDHMMPEMNGVEALKRIRALPGKKYQVVPIVALTANATNDARVMFLAEGFDGFLAKPIETAKLNDVLKKWLQDINDERGASLPKELKQVGSQQSLTDDMQSFLRIFQSAREIDFKRGVTAVHSLEAYSKILRTYYKSTGDKLPRLMALVDDDFDRMVIEIHGLKGASAAVGAFGLFDLAQDLEDLGQKRDVVGVKINLPVYVERARASLIEAAEFLQAFDLEHKVVNSLGKSDWDSIPLTLLDSLEQAFLDYDTEQLKVLIDDLKSKVGSERDNSFANKMQEYYDAYEFDKPVEEIKAHRAVLTNAEE